MPLISLFLLFLPLWWLVGLAFPAFLLALTWSVLLLRGTAGTVLHPRDPWANACLLAYATFLAVYGVRVVFLLGELPAGLPWDRVLSSLQGLLSWLAVGVVTAGWLLWRDQGAAERAGQALWVNAGGILLLGLASLVAFYGLQIDRLQVPNLSVFIPVDAPVHVHRLFDADVYVTDILVREFPRLVLLSPFSNGFGIFALALAFLLLALPSPVGPARFVLALAVLFFAQFSLSRYILVATPLLLATYALAHALRRHAMLTLMVSACLASCLLAAWLLEPAWLAEVLPRWVSADYVAGLRAGSTQTRLFSYSAAVEHTWHQNFAYGLGYKEKDATLGAIAIGSHSTYVGILVKTGLLGSIVFALFLLLALGCAVHLCLQVFFRSGADMQRATCLLLVLLAIAGWGVIEDLDAQLHLPVLLGIVLGEILWMRRAGILMEEAA